MQLLRFEKSRHRRLQRLVCCTTPRHTTPSFRKHTRSPPPLPTHTHSPTLTLNAASPIHVPCPCLRNKRLHCRLGKRHQLAASKKASPCKRCKRCKPVQARASRPTEFTVLLTHDPNFPVWNATTGPVNSSMRENHAKLTCKIIEVDK